MKPLWTCAFALLCAFGALAQDGRALLAERLARNPAWRRAQQAPVYNPLAPSGFVLDEAEKARQRAAGAKLQAEVAAAIASGQREFRMKPGQYRFADNRGWHFDGVHDFVLDGQGSTLWFERPASRLADNPGAFLFTNCSGVTVKDLAIDFDGPVYIQGAIRAIAPDRASLEVEIDPDWPKSGMGPGQFTLYTPSGEYIPQHTLMHNGAVLHDGNRLTVKLDRSQLAPYFTKTPWTMDARMYGKVAPGTLIALNFRRGHSISVTNCERMVFERVDVWQSPGMGILENGGAGHNRYSNLRLIRKPGTRRVHYGTADHFHANCVEHGALVENCEFAHSSDDNLNLHGNWRYCWRQISPTRIILGAPKPPLPGQRLTLRRIGRLQRVAEAAIASVQPLRDAALLQEIAAQRPQANGHVTWRGNGQLFLVELDSPVRLPPEQLLADAHVDTCAGFVVRGCYFHDSRSRGALLVGPGRLENNVWENVYDGIYVFEESWGYAEGPIPHGVEIIGNTLVRCGGIETGLVPRDTAQGVWNDTPIRDVEIRGNLIVEGAFIHVMYADGAVIAENIFWNPLPCARRTGDFRSTMSQYGHPRYLGMERRAAVFVTASRNIEVTGNRVFLATPGTLSAVQLGKFADAPTIRCRNNTVTRVKAN